MSRVDNRKDALLLLLYAPGSSGETCEPIRGRTRLMKLAFLLERRHDFAKRAGIRNYYRFEPYKFGPFSKELYDDISFLENLRYIKARELGDPPIAELSEDQRILEEWLIADDTEDESRAGFQEEEFTLTERGREFAAGLFNSLSREKRRALSEVKGRYGALPLTSLLRFVYRTYPKEASETELPHLR